MCNFTYFYEEGTLCPLFVPQCTLEYVSPVLCVPLFPGMYVSLSIRKKTVPLIVVVIPIDMYRVSDSPRIPKDSTARVANLLNS